MKNSTLAVITGCVLAITATVVNVTTGNRDVASALMLASWVPMVASLVLSYRHGR